MIEKNESHVGWSAEKVFLAVWEVLLWVEQVEREKEIWKKWSPWSVDTLYSSSDISCLLEIF